MVEYIPPIVDQDALCFLLFVGEAASVYLLSSHKMRLDTKFIRLLDS